jgi:hypothetical protein
MRITGGAVSEGFTSPYEARPLLLQIRNVPIFLTPKKTRTGPSVPVRVLSSKKSHEGGGEHSADDLDKAICVPTRSGRKKRFGAVNPASDSPSGK